MSTFEFVTGALLIIVGLGITQLLTRLADLFMHRHESKPHWIPLVWAIIVFVYQMQFLWSAFELSSLIETWTATSFVLLIIYALILFLAGVLVVPSRRSVETTDAFDFFMKHGRWSLLALLFYQVWATLVNPVLFDVELLDPLNMIGIPGMIILISTFYGRTKTWWTAGTVLYLIYSIIIMVLLSPGQY